MTYLQSIIMSLIFTLIVYGLIVGSYYLMQHWENSHPQMTTVCDFMRNNLKLLLTIEEIIVMLSFNVYGIWLLVDLVRYQLHLITMNAIVYVGLRFGFATWLYLLFKVFHVIGKYAPHWNYETEFYPTVKNGKHVAKEDINC